MTGALILIIVVLLFVIALGIGLAVFFVDRLLDLFRSPWNRKHDGR